MKRPRRTSALRAAVVLSAAVLPLAACSSAAAPPPAAPLIRADAHAAEQDPPAVDRLAAPRCAVTATLPSRLVLGGGATDVTTTVRARPAGCADYVRFDVLAADGSRVAQNLFTGRSRATWQAAGPGEYTAAFSWGYDTSRSGLTGTSSRPMEARWGSALSGWASSRAHGSHTVRLRVTVRVATGAGWTDGAGRTVVFERRGAAGWQRVATARTDADGLARATLRSGTATWRAMLAATADTWGATTGAHRR